MKLFAHRGYSARYPENTMEAFQKAYEKGFDGIETDVHMTKDGRLVLIHDETIDRTSNGQGYIHDYTYEELKEFSFGNGQPGFYALPLLEDLLSFIQNHPIKVNIELKTDVIHYENIEKKVWELVNQYGVAQDIYYSSFYLPSLLRMKELDSNAYLGYLIEDQYTQKYQELMKYQIAAFHPEYTLLNEKRMAELKKNHIFVVSWTAPDFHEYQRLKELGVDIIISNEYLR